MLIRNDTILFLKRSLKAILLVRMIARFSFAFLITCHKLHLDSGSKPVVGSSMNTTCSKLPSHIISSFFLNQQLNLKLKGRNLLTWASPIREIATVSLLFIPPLYAPTSWLRTFFSERFTIFKRESTSCMFYYRKKKSEFIEYVNYVNFLMTVLIFKSDNNFNHHSNRKYKVYKQVNATCWLLWLLNVSKLPSWAIKLNTIYYFFDQSVCFLQLQTNCRKQWLFYYYYPFNLCISRKLSLDIKSKYSTNFTAQ